MTDNTPNDVKAIQTVLQLRLALKVSAIAAAIEAEMIE